MKKIFLVLLGVFAASSVYAANACTVIEPAATALFVVRGFTPKCSANVTAEYLENAVAFAVGAVSSKGKSRFQGTSGGGTVNGQPCAGPTCVATDAATGLQAKLDAAT